MEQTVGSRVLDPRVDDPRPGKSAASWGAIIAGAVVAVSVSLILLALGSGLGFAEISPWPNRGVSPTTFTVTAAIWLIVTQWVSAAFGGYIAGRLRSRWIGTHAHEVFFRDTAHGFVTWSLATVFVAAVVTSSVFSVVGGGVRVAANAASSAASAGAQGLASQGPEVLSPGPAAGHPPGGSPSMGYGPMSYGIDKLFRPADAASAGPNSQGFADPRIEAGRILANAAANGGSVPDEDRSYLAGLVAARAGISQSEAQRRVDDLIAAAKEADTKARAAADAARKAASETSIYTALSMLIGAFIACIAAALGGRLRDEHL